VAIFLYHEACPKCNSRDNLAVYSDGGKWCFGCGYSVSSSISGFVKQAQEVEEKEWHLPKDLTQDFPPVVLQYITKFNLTIEELIKYDYYYSGWTGRLWRVFHSGRSGQLCSALRGGPGAAEARQLYVNMATSTGPKSRFFGSKEDVFAIAGTENSGTKRLVLTEDSFSSIKVGGVYQAMPLFGTSISMSKVGRLAQQFESVVVWLDHDKFKEAWEIALKFKWLGVHTDVVLTKLDPKYHSEQEIMELVK